MNKIFPGPSKLIEECGKAFFGPRAKKIKSPVWQGIKNITPMIELFDNSYRMNLINDLEELKKECDPDLPWADDHFDERVGRSSTNPGHTFKYWPYYREDSYRDGIFTHTYQERFWPKYAAYNHNMTDEHMKNIVRPVKGIRFEYGDLDDVVNHLFDNPDSRQAYFPIWFPEDTGVNHKGRVPCSLGYLFSYRDGFLHISYDLRSCDYIRHFRNDVYFVNRLGLWFLNELRSRPQENIDWNKVKLGFLSLHITSFHIFESDKYELNKRLNK